MNSFTYRTKPVLVEAFKYAKLDSDETVAIPQWLMEAVRKGVIYLFAPNSTDWNCITRNGPVRINPNDYIIRLADGEIYPCDETVFNSKYEKVEDCNERT